MTRAAFCAMLWLLSGCSSGPGCTVSFQDSSGQQHTVALRAGDGQIICPGTQSWTTVSKKGDTRHGG